MSNVYQFQTEDQIEETASLWVSRLDRGLSEEEVRALRAWLAASYRHQEVFLEMAELFDRMDSLSVLSELFDPPAVQAEPVRRVGRMAWAVAASVLALVFAVNLIVPQMPWNPFAGEGEARVVASGPTLYETGIGAHSTINLPDGTKLLLNTDTRVAVTYSEHERLLVLKKGELHVKVAHDKERPLRVRAGDRIVEAVGTAFNVYLKDERNFDVIVTEGRVQVKPLKIKQGVNVESRPVKELVQGQKLEVRNSQPEDVQDVDSAVIDDRLSWREGKLVFRGETLREALDELGRYTPSKFEIVDERIAGMRIAGFYKAGDVEGLLMALRENLNIESRRSGNDTIQLRLMDSADSGTGPSG